MNYIDGVEPVTVLKSKSAELIGKARRTRQPVVITQNGKPTAVLQDIDSFEEQRQALLMLLAIGQGDRDHRAGHTISDRISDRRARSLLAKLARA